MKRHKSRKSNKYVYQLFELVDEDELKELAQRNGMNANYIHNACQKGVMIYGKFKVGKRLKGENDG